jgi:hypothetical protein
MGRALAEPDGQHAYSLLQRKPCRERVDSQRPKIKLWALKLYLYALNF